MNNVVLAEHIVTLESSIILLNMLVLLNTFMLFLNARRNFIFYNFYLPVVLGWISFMFRYDFYNLLIYLCF
jgi:hypothetical protein